MLDLQPSGVGGRTTPSQDGTVLPGQPRGGTISAIPQ